MNENAGVLEILLPMAALLIAFWFLWCFLKGAVILFKRAAESSIWHVLLFFIGWIVVAPIMVIWSFFVGVVA
jgi:hypothetical protein